MPSMALSVMTVLMIRRSRQGRPRTPGWTLARLTEKSLTRFAFDFIDNVCPARATYQFICTSNAGKKSWSAPRHTRVSTLRAREEDHCLEECVNHTRKVYLVVSFKFNDYWIAFVVSNIAHSARFQINVNPAVLFELSHPDHCLDPCFSPNDYSDQVQSVCALTVSFSAGGTLRSAAH
ncbi:hypothetical protein BDY19DRAFT_414086 [Irpex rosettiformis]|uniref:Uncharacterized protein n=1 Tax=Irpex rosettiformis TaxID=378272 RepID=A0ACB8UFX6_9APHY|nr:hypothetical protein BDY19DRAFT_414086 [Irpex rosettiformis]